MSVAWPRRRHFLRPALVSLKFKDVYGVHVKGDNCITKSHSELGEVEGFTTCLRFRLLDRYEMWAAFA